ncbi:MAG TPA: M20 family metallopeptidase [Bacteroidales bacterium]|nr:M20 family metallopeptidase [Bacteroidales bacterium]
MKNIIEEIKALSKELHSDIIQIRRYLHKNPEISFSEFNTALYLKNLLINNGIETDDSFGKNAVIGIIHGGLPGDTIGLRADIDALPIIEKTNLEFSSVNKGVMHACGHDAHAASLIGTALILNKLKDKVKGKIILIFQPAEEKIPGGAKLLVEQGLLKKYNIKRIIGQHVLPEMKTGHFCFGDGFVMAATDELYIKFNGVGGHAAVPQKRSDTVMALVEFIHEAKELQKKLISDMPFIIAFGKIVADGVLNVIPSQSSADGTMRTFDENLRIEIKKQLEIIAAKSAASYKCTFDLEIRHGYPSVYNDPSLTKQVIEAATKYLSEKNIEKMEVRMTAEDFAYYGKEIPAVFYRMGISGNDKGNIGLHNDQFDIDEDAFLYSIGLMAFIALSI